MISAESLHLPLHNKIQQIQMHRAQQAVSTESAFSQLQSTLPGIIHPDRGLVITRQSAEYHKRAVTG